MPTTRPRYTLTETDELKAVLDRAARRWPQDAGSRRRLLQRLIAAGDAKLEDEQAGRRQRRIEAAKRITGQFDGLYPPGYLKELRRDWPE